MRKIIHFNPTSSEWRNNNLSNRMFLGAARIYLKDLLKYRGYLYLNQIYECLGMPWNPDEKNVCYRNSDAFYIDIDAHADSETTIQIVIG